MKQLLLAAVASLAICGQAFSQGPPTPPKTGPLQTQNRLDEIKFNGTDAQAAARHNLGDVLSPNYGIIDISQPGPFHATCDGTDTIDISTIVQSALNTGRNVGIPPCPTNSGYNWIMGNLVNSQRNKLIGIGGGRIKAAVGSDFLYSITGSGGGWDGLVVSVTDDVGQWPNTMRRATVASGATFGSQSITLADQTGTFKVGQRLNVLMDDGYFFTDTITSVAGDVIGFTKHFPYKANVGNIVWASFGEFYITCNATLFTGSNTQFVGGGGIGISCPLGGGTSPNAGLIYNINQNKGWMFGVWCGSGCSGNEITHINFVGGWINKQLWNGDGATREFSNGGFHAWSNINPATNPIIKVNDVTLHYPGDWTFSDDGLSTIFTVAPSAGFQNVSIQFRVFSSEGFKIDPTGGVRSSGVTASIIQSGQADTACGFEGGLNLSVNHNFSNSECGPGWQTSLLLNNTGAVYISNAYAANAVNSLKMSRSAVVVGNLNAIPALATTLVSGFPGLPFVSDPLGTYTGNFNVQNTAGTYQFDQGKFIYGINQVPSPYAAASCTTVGVTAAGSYWINDCEPTSGTILANQQAVMQASGNASIALDVMRVNVLVTGDFAVGQAIYCSTCEAGTQIIADLGIVGGLHEWQLNYSQTVASRTINGGIMPQWATVVGYSAAHKILLTDRTGVEIPDGTVLNFAGPPQPTGNFGPRRISYQQYATPISGSTVTYDAGVSFLILSPSTNLAALTVQLPACTSLNDGQAAGFSSTVTITTLTVTDAGGGTVRGSPAGLTAGGTGGRMSYLCRGGQTSWFPG